MTRIGPATVHATKAPRRAAFAIGTLIVLLLLLLAGAGQARTLLGAGPQWYWLAPQPQGADLQAVDFADASHGWAIGDAGSVIATANGGLTWTKQATPTTTLLCGVSFPTRTFGVAVGWNGTIVRTTNRGKTWAAMPSRVTRDLYAVSFPTTLRGWAVGKGGLVLTTANGGRTWTKQTSPTTYDLKSVTSVDDTHAWACGNGGYLLRTTDAGKNWRALNFHNSSSYDFLSLTFTDRLHGWAAAQGGDVAMTSDGGVTWQDDTPSSAAWWATGIVAGSGRVWLVCQPGLIMSQPLAGGDWVEQTSGTPAYVYGIARRSGDDLVAVGQGGTMIASDDGGTTWTSLCAGVPARFNDVSFADASHGWAVGAEQAAATSVIYETKDGGRSWASQPVDDVNWFGGVDMIDADRGWAVGWGGAIYRTDSGGQSWTRQPLPNGEPTTTFYAVAATDDLHACAVGWADNYGADCSMRATADGGVTWSLVDIGTTERLNDVTFADVNHGWAVGYNGTVVATTDGSKWAAQTTPTTSELKSVSFYDDLVGWAVGYDGTIIATTDGGVTWTAQSSGGTDILEEVFFASATRGWIVDQFGPILSTTDGGAHWKNAGKRTTTLVGGCLFDATHAWAIGEWGAVLGLDVVRPVAKATAPSGVRHSAVTVRFKASDTQSGVARIQYRIGGGAWKTGSSARVTRNGTTVVSYRATDNAANTSAVKRVTVRIAR